MFSILKDGAGPEFATVISHFERQDDEKSLEEKVSAVPADESVALPD